MAETDPAPEVYQFRVWLRGISPAIWRRLRLRSDQTLADLHYSLQIVYGWSDEHLHRFAIRAPLRPLPPGRALVYPVRGSRPSA
jgi:hypothetical protein